MDYWKSGQNDQQRIPALVSTMCAEPAWSPIEPGQIGKLTDTTIFRLSIRENEPHLSAAEKQLTNEEYVRAYRFRQHGDRSRFILARSTLRKILGLYTGIEPTGVPLVYNSFGKPILQKDIANQLHFNISHSEDYVLIAFSKDTIGVDIEHLVAAFPYEELITEVFSPAEIDHIKQSARPDTSFYLYWTRKEAFLKNIGRGLSFPIKAIPVLNGSHPITFHVPSSYETLSFYCTDDYIGSICRKLSPPSPIYFHHLKL